MGVVLVFSVFFVFVVLYVCLFECVSLLFAGFSRIVLGFCCWFFCEPFGCFEPCCSIDRLWVDFFFVCLWAFKTVFIIHVNTVMLGFALFLNKSEFQRFFPWTFCNEARRRRLGQPFQGDILAACCEKAVVGYVGMYIFGELNKKILNRCFSV